MIQIGSILIRPARVKQYPNMVFGETFLPTETSYSKDMMLRGSRCLKIVLVVLVFGHCATTKPAVTRPSSSPAVAEDQPPPLTITVLVREQPQTDSWQVTYQFSKPVRGMVFLRKRSRFRHSSWKLAQADHTTWGEHNEAEAIFPVSGSTLQNVKLTFASDFEDKAKDYGLNIAFSEGSRLLYTGHLAVLPLVCENGLSCAQDKVVKHAGPADHVWKFSTDKLRSIRLLELAQEGVLSWTPTDKQISRGTYVYFGPIKPTKDKRLTMIIDPGMPAWMIKQTRHLMPKFFNYYAAQTGAELDFHPLVFLSYRPGDPKIGNLGGGTLEGLVQLAAIGGYWKNQDSFSTLLWFKFLAHESFHLWNGQMFSSTRLGITGEWLSEGAAEYFAFKALRAFDLIDHETFARLVSTAANRCMLSLQGKPLLTAHRTGNYRSFYTCGATTHFLVDHIIQKSTKGKKDISTVFAAVFSKAQKTERIYSTFDYLESIQQISGDPLAVGPIERILHLGIPEHVDQFFLKVMTDAGIDASLVPPHEAAMEKEDFMRLLGEVLAQCDCGPRRSISRYSDHLHFYPLPQCNMFKNGMKVSHVAGIKLKTDPGQALSEVWSKIRSGMPIKMEELSSGKTSSLTCSADQPNIPVSGLLRVNVVKQ